MDEMVLAALKKWPNVPACTGWLGLDARGQWWMRDAATQALGSFQAGCASSTIAMKGSLLKHDKLIAFIQRNYGLDPLGRAWFQNGPQRVFVELEAAPFVLRLNAEGQLHAHAGNSRSADGQLPLAGECAIQTGWLDESGHLYYDFHHQGALRLGRIHTQDMHLAATALDAGQLPAPSETELAQLQTRYHYLLSPDAAELSLTAPSTPS